jgi:arylsulfatase A-like enzyme
MKVPDEGACEPRAFARHTGALVVVLMVGVLPVPHDALRCATGASRTRQPASVQKLNLLVITLDTTRADRIAAYRGSRPAATPHLNRLAREGVLFEDATSPAPLTLPAHCTLFSGLLPPRHGVRENVGRLDSATPTLASLLRARGYRTGAFVAAEVLARSRGLYLGFDIYDDEFQPGNAPHAPPRRGAAAVITRAIQWISAGKSSSPFFVWIHVYDAHAPYEAPPAFDRAYPGRPYEAAIASVDAQIGRVLAFLDQTGLIDRTLITVIGDHGEALGEHGELTHGLFVYQSVLRVPFIVRIPGIGLRGRRVKTAVSSVDLMPTVLELLRADLPKHVDGRSLVQTMVSGAGGAPDMYAENLYARRRFGWSEMRAIRSGFFKLIEKTNPELYDLEHDPSETRDLAAERPALVARLTRRLHAWDSRLEPAVTVGGAPQTVPADVRGQLASLGYIGAPPGRANYGRVGSDPRDHVDLFNCLATPGRAVASCAR